MIAATAEAVGARDQRHGVTGLIARRLPSHVARDLPRRRILWRLREHADLAGVADTGAAAAAADDVVVEDGVDAPAFLRGARRVQRRADETLLLAGERDENERGVELDLASREHARRLQHHRRARAIVVRAGRVVVGARPVEA